MAKEQSEYLILKLRSGDEIVAKKNGSKRGYLLLHRPLQLQRSTLLDPSTGEIKKNICVFRDWLEFTTGIECEIPDDFVVMSGVPSPDLVKRYLVELNNLDNPRKPPKNTAPSSPSKDIKEEILDQFFKNLPKEDKSAPDIQSILAKMAGLPQQNQSMVTATFQMPPEVFMNIMLNLPLFDMGDIGDIGDMGGLDDDETDFGDDDSDDEPKTPKPPKNTPKKNKPKPNPDEEPPEGWNGRFGFPK
jgi:hypothetical protein